MVRNDFVKSPQGRDFVPFQPIKEACRTTGLSQYYLRRGCQDGTIPHVMTGSKYMVDVPALLDKLRKGSEVEK